MKEVQWQDKLIPWIGLALLFYFGLAACQSDSGEPLPTVVAQEDGEKLPTPSPLSEPLGVTTSSPTTQRLEPIVYTTEEGDTLSSISTQFDISPQTLIWANYQELFDNPDYLLSGMDLLILPTDGVYHQVGGSDTLLSLAAFFDVEASAILDWPANHLDAQNTAVQAGQWLMVPGGRRASRWRQMPNILRQNAALSAEEFGSGACDDNYSNGPQGDGDYAWPVDDPRIAAEAFEDWHLGVDLVASPSQLVKAADDGVVVFSGWSNLGYGNLLMIDHGNDDFSLYAGLSGLIAACGHAVERGDPIAEAGHTGHPAGPMLHFEIRRGDEFLDPFALISSQ